MLKNVSEYSTNKIDWKETSSLLSIAISTASTNSNGILDQQEKNVRQLTTIKNVQNEQSKKQPQVKLVLRQKRRNKDSNNEKQTRIKRQYHRLEQELNHENKVMEVIGTSTRADKHLQQYLNKQQNKNNNWNWTTTTNVHKTKTKNSKRYGRRNDFGKLITNVVTINTLSELEKFGMEFWRGTFCSRFYQLKSFHDPNHVELVPPPRSTKNHNNNNHHYHYYHPIQVLFNITFSCHDLFTNGRLGTGNYIMAFYALRLAAHQIGSTDVSIQCHDAEQYKDSLILPWMMGKFSRTTWTHTMNVSHTRINPTIHEACTEYTVGYMLDDIQFELRRMAIAIAGIPYPTHPSFIWAQENLWSNDDADTMNTNNDSTTLQLRSNSKRMTRRRSYTMQILNPIGYDTIPLIPNVEIDDVAIHFRCGDIVESDDNNRFGFMKFTSITKYISSNVKSIGIVTQPFFDSSSSGSSGSSSGSSGGEYQQRLVDINPMKYAKCRTIVYALEQYLHTVFNSKSNSNTNNNTTINNSDEHGNSVRITIRNDVQETIALTYARMILANQSIIGTTTFGTLAGMASFGTSYILNRIPNSILLVKPNITTTTNNNIQLIDEPILFSKTCKTYWNHSNNGEMILDWFRTEESELDRILMEKKSIEQSTTRRI